MPKGQRRDWKAETFGYLQPISDSFVRDGHCYAMCKCSLCGDVKAYFIGNLHSGKSTRCRDCGNKQAGLTKRSRFSHRQRTWMRSLKHRNNIDSRWPTLDAVLATTGPWPNGMVPSAKDRRRQIGPDNWEFRKTARSVTKLANVLEGKSLADWGDALGITRERVRQLIDKHGDIRAVMSHRRAMGLSYVEL